MNLQAYRTGQGQGHQVLVFKLQNGDRYIAIVLPTRYGKSDLILVGSYDAYQQGLISGAIVLSPAATLRNQLVRPDKMQERIDRYELPAFKAKAIKTTAALQNPFANGEVVVSMTTQLACQTRDILCDLALSMEARTGKPLLLWIDETHMASTKNAWGEIVQMLAEETNTRFAMCTATPWRSDNTGLQGFDYELVSEETIQYNTAHSIDEEYILLKSWEKQRSLMRIKADHETSFQEAWADNILCHLNREPIDVDVIEDRGLADTLKSSLQELSASKVREVLGQVIRDGGVEKYGAEKLVECLRIRKEMDRTCAAIVFTGNDEEGGNNQHAQSLKMKIQEIEPDFHVVIATTKVENADTKIDSFCRKGVGDVLIVKQMAGLGLDCERLKVLLHLSSIRAPASWLQAVMRVATPFKGMLTADVILPADSTNNEMWDGLIERQGGAIGESWVGNDPTLVDTQVVKKKDEPKPWYKIDNPHSPFYDDSKGIRGDPALRDLVERVVRACPNILNFYTKADISHNLSETPEPRPDSIYVDIEEDCQSLRSRINNLQRRIAMFDSIDGEVPYEEVWKEAKKRSGVFEKPKDVFEKGRLEKLFCTLKDMAVERGLVE